VESLLVPSDRSAAARARHFVRDTLEAWGIDGETQEDCELLVSELVTNAVMHAHSGALVSMEGDRDLVKISVRDESTAPPTVQECSPSEIAGRGLLLVSRIARRWGVEAWSGGKAVWFELVPRPPTPA
jgi:anti-sigma regulatory factor (Ser/Thr protein kinase)